jgi:hypothetical protein
MQGVTFLDKEVKTYYVVTGAVTNHLLSKYVIAEEISKIIFFTKIAIQKIRMITLYTHYN